MSKNSSRISFSKLAEQNCLSITPRELGIDKTMFKVDIIKLKKFLVPLIVETPCNQSNYGKKLKEYDFYKDKNKVNDKIYQILKKLGVIDSFYFFYSYNSQVETKHDLKNEIINCTKPCLFLRIDQAILESLYSSIRNALAHGNIITRNGYIELFCVSERKKDNSFLDNEVTFFLRIDNLMKLEAYLKL